GMDEVAVLLVHGERHQRAAVLELDLADVADADAGDADRLPLAGDDRLRGGELGLQRPGRLVDDRQPQALVLERVQADGAGDEEDPDHRPEAEAVAEQDPPRGRARSAAIDHGVLLSRWRVCSSPSVSGAERTLSLRV